MVNSYGTFDMTTRHYRRGESPGADTPGHPDTGPIMNDTTRVQRARQAVVDALARFHDDDSGVAMTEYIIVFTLISFGATVALIATAAFIKGYRDFMVWWLGHPAV